MVKEGDPAAAPDATVVVLGRYRGRALHRDPDESVPHGGAFESAFAHVWRIRDGRIVRLDQVATAAVAALAPEKNPAAVALGRLGGSNGGAARAASFTPEQRQEIARNAAAKRWAKRDGR